ncbi:glycosyltransferase family 2 protein [Desulfococcus sp.]|uniref:glycosyltransferase family 2 protein n=1 Tax=Desulfococcus sp. TaxID=2025834 RepID=UPI0035930FE7
MPPDLEQRAFAVVIPVYNHEGRVREVASAAAGLGMPVIVVDDGSTDGSYEAVRDLPGIEILRHPKNQGKGAALLTGFARAAGFARWAVTLDADGQHDPAEIPGMIQTLGPGERAIVVGAREGMDGVHVPWTSRFGRKFSNFWVWIAGGPRMADSQSGFRVYPLPETLHLDVAARRFQYEVEVLVKARWKGIRVREVPVTVSYHPGMPRISHFRPFIDFMRNSRTFSRLILRRIFVPKTIRGKRPPTP